MKIMQGCIGNDVYLSVSPNLIFSVSRKDEVSRCLHGAFLLQKISEMVILTTPENRYCFYLVKMKQPQQQPQNEIPWISKKILLYRTKYYLCTKYLNCDII